VRTLRSICGKTAALYELVKNPRMQLGAIVAPMNTLVKDLRGALHEGTVGKHPEFWDIVIENVITDVSHDAHAKKLLSAGEPSTFGQMHKLVDELEAFPSRPFVRGHNRYELVVAFCNRLGNADISRAREG
jgi:hypothetical protein